MSNDLRYSIRSLRRSPVLVCVAVLSLALGIGANVSIFSLLDQVILRAMPVVNPSELVILKATGPQPGWSTSDNPESVFSYPMYRDLRDRNEVFKGIAGRGPAAISVRVGGETERASADLVTGNFFQLLGVRAAIGRLLMPEDDVRPGGHPVAVISHGYWKRRFGMNSSVLNQVVGINGKPMTIIGVVQDGFIGLNNTAAVDVFLPMAMKRAATPTWDGMEEREAMWINLAARLKSGTSREQALAGLQPLYRSLREAEWAGKRGDERAKNRFLEGKLELRDGGQGINMLRRQMESRILALMGMVGFVLLIACVNVANLLLAKAAGRRRELSVRLAIGASRWQIMRQLLVESFLLAAMGGMASLMVATWTTDALVKIFGNTDTPLKTTLDPRMLLFAGAVSLLTGLIFGLTPALRASGEDVMSAIKEQASALRSGLRHARLRRWLVAAQVALSMMLLIPAGLFAKSLYVLLRLDPGFQTANLLHFRIAPKLSGYDNARALALYQQMQERLGQLPNVQSVSAAEIAVIEGNFRGANVTVEGYRAKEDEDMDVAQSPVGPAYFRTLGIPLVEGREFEVRDGEGAPKVVIVNRKFAEYFFGKASPIGRRMTFGSGTVKLDREIVGVVDNSRYDGLREAIPRMVYFPYMQDAGLPGLSFYVRTDREQDSLGDQVRSVARELDANVPVFRMYTMRQQVQSALNSERMMALLSNAFGLLATLLAAIGLYGVVASGVAERTGEIGIRMALGASRADVVGMVLREVGGLVLAGGVAGVLTALAMGRYIQAQLFGVEAHDPLVMMAAVGVLSVAALAAGYVPARRAAAIDPMSALRHT
ncbi:MAG: ABC transporter permease [Bryobacterales bacterium]|nr:ABC transporter permease [Bryobacterales bacterium]